MPDKLWRGWIWLSKLNIGLGFYLLICEIFMLAWFSTKLWRDWVSVLGVLVNCFWESLQSRIKPEIVKHSHTLFLSRCLAFSEYIFHIKGHSLMHNTEIGFTVEKKKRLI